MDDVKVYWIDSSACQHIKIELEIDELIHDLGQQKRRSNDEFWRIFAAVGMYVCQYVCLSMCLFVSVCVHMLCVCVCVLVNVFLVDK